MLIAEQKRLMPDLQEALLLHENVIRERNQEKEVQCSLADVSDEATPGRPANYIAATHARELARMREKAKKWQIKHAKVKDLLTKMKNKISVTDVPESEPLVDQGNDTILQEMVSLLGVHKCQRRYSESFYRFAYIFLTLSPRAYKYVRKKLILPSKTSVWRHFREATSSMKKSVTDLSSVHELLEAFLRSHNPGCQRIVATLAVDAFAFRLFLRSVASVLKIKEKLKAKLQCLRPFLEDPKLIDEINELDEDVTNCEDPEVADECDGECDDECDGECDDECDGECDDVDETVQTDKEEGRAEDEIESLFDVYNHCFMYVLIPLRSDIPSLTLHLCPAQNGSANQQHAQILDELTHICHNYNIDIVYVSMDGDASWNWKFQETLDVIAPHLHSPLCDKALTVQDACWPLGVHRATTDLLHLLKRARGRYLDHVITPTISSISPTNYDKVCTILKCGPELTDKSQLGRMRDFYPLELFTVSNVLLLMKKKCFADSFYFMPFTLMLLVIRVPFFRQDFQLALLEATFSMFRHVYNDILAAQKRSGSENKPAEKVVQRPRQDSRLVTFAELSVLERILCTLYAYAAAFQSHPDCLRTDSLGTHIVEEKIGQARHGMDDRWTRMLSTITQSLLRSIMLGIEQVELGSPSRLKATGCCIDGTGDFYIDDFDPTLFARVMTHSISDSARAASDFRPSWNRIRSWLKSIDEVLTQRSGEIGKVWMPSPGAHSGIMARLLKTGVSSITGS